MYTKEPHITYKRLKSISLTLSTVILSLIQNICKWFLFPSSGGKKVFTLTPGPSQSSLHFQVLLLSHHFSHCPSTMSRYLKWSSPSSIANKNFLFPFTTHAHHVINIKNQWSYTVKPWYSATVCSPHFVLLYPGMW